jgi:hypothetical protein
MLSGFSAQLHRRDRIEAIATRYYCQIPTIFWLVRVSKNNPENLAVEAGSAQQSVTRDVKVSKQVGDESFVHLWLWAL